ncbi:MAG: hypothetical protein EA371_10630 [Gammaproteobacteria bacterium]|nr:MAG: hypothetical protein EA371_10630 [Gammaproteobacteria bacterium]
MPQRIAVLFPLFASLLVGCGMRGAPEAPPLAMSDPELCAGFQTQLSLAPLDIATEIHDDWEAFVLAKPTVEPLVIHQMAFAAVAGGRAEGVSCKLKGADHLAEVVGPEQVIDDLSCSDFNREIFMGQAEALQAEGVALALDPASLHFVADERANRGTQWLDPMPWHGVHRDAEGRVQVQAKAMISPLKSWTPIPRAWKGMFYCHLVAPEHARALLAGEVAPPDA